jgi:hypothetical protein
MMVQAYSADESFQPGFVPVGIFSKKKIPVKFFLQRITFPKAAEWHSPLIHTCGRYLPEYHFIIPQPPDEWAILSAAAAGIP